LHEEDRTKITEILKNSEDHVNELIEKYTKGELEALPGWTMAETLELKILELLNKARNETGKVVAKHINKESPISIMVESGARGTRINLAQIAGCVGQQALRGRRIERGFNERPLSCFRRRDLKSKARGFIGSNFKTGLTPSEFFFMAMTGRDSLMDTALRTPKSGYLYRRLANAMQDLKVEYDQTVRDASRKVVQYSYGEDGMDVSKSEGGTINVKRIINHVLREE